MELYFMTLKIDEKFEEKLIRGLENDRGSLVNFHQGTRYTKKKMYELKNYRGVICHDIEE